MYPEEIKIEKYTCTPLFIAALLTIARTWKQPRFPHIDEWIKQLWDIYTTEYYSAIKRNAFESVLMRWMNLEPIIQSGVLGPMVVFFLVFFFFFFLTGISILSSIVAVTIYIPTNSARGLPFFHTLCSTYCF